MPGCRMTNQLATGTGDRDGKNQQTRKNARFHGRSTFMAHLTATIRRCGVNRFSRRAASGKNDVATTGAHMGTNTGYHEKSASADVGRDWSSTRIR